MVESNNMDSKISQQSDPIAPDKGQEQAAMVLDPVVASWISQRTTPSLLLAAGPQPVRKHPMTLSEVLFRL